MHTLTLQTAISVNACHEITRGATAIDTALYLGGIDLIRANRTVLDISCANGIVLDHRSGDSVASYTDGAVSGDWATTESSACTNLGDSATAHVVGLTSYVAAGINGANAGTRSATAGAPKHLVQRRGIGCGGLYCIVWKTESGLAVDLARSGHIPR